MEKKASSKKRKRTDDRIPALYKVAISTPLWSPVYWVLAHNVAAAARKALAIGNREYTSRCSVKSVEHVSAIVYRA